LSVHYLNKWLVKRGIDVTVYTTDINGKKTLDVPYGTPVDIDGVKVLYFPHSWPRSWENSKELYTALERDLPKAGLLHITSVFLSASKKGVALAKKYNKPCIISPRGSLMKEPLTQKSAFKKKLYIALIEKKNLAGADMIHFTVEKEKEEYIEAGLPIKKSVIIPNSLDREDFDRAVPSGYFRQKHGIDEQAKVILHLARISWKKGFDTLIPAFAKVVEAHPDALLVIAGGDDEGYKKEVERMIERHGIQDKVKFTGMILSEEKIGALQDADVFSLPSYSENFGMAVVEAMYFKLPVVITGDVGIAGKIKNAGAGIVIKKDVGELARALNIYIENPQKGKEDGARGTALVKDIYAMDAVADEFIKIYRELIPQS